MKADSIKESAIMSHNKVIAFVIVSSSLIFIRQSFAAEISCPPTFSGASLKDARVYDGPTANEADLIGENGVGD